MNEILAETPGLGQIVLCKSCAQVRVACGNAAVRMSKEAFLSLCRMIRTAAEHGAIKGVDRPTLYFEDGQPVGQIH